MPAVARSLESAVRTPLIAEQVSSCAACAVADAASAPGRLSTVIMPADVSWSPTETVAAPVPPSPASGVPAERIEHIAALLGRDSKTALLLGGAACREDGLRAASRIAAATEIRVFVQTFPARLERGAGLPRLGFYPQQAAAQLEGASHVLVAGIHEPGALFFAYRNRPSSPVPGDADTVTLADVHEDVAGTLTDLAAIVAPATTAKIAAAGRAAMPTGQLTLQSWPQVMRALLPENAIIVDQSISSGQALPAATAGARHDLHSLTGGAMGMGLPLATRRRDRRTRPAGHPSGRRRMRDVHDLRPLETRTRAPDASPNRARTPPDRGCRPRDHLRMPAPLTPITTWPPSSIRDGSVHTHPGRNKT